MNVHDKYVVIFERMLWLLTPHPTLTLGTAGEPSKNLLLQRSHICGVKLSGASGGYRVLGLLEVFESV
jgi:hypothetical protein